MHSPACVNMFEFITDGLLAKVFEGFSKRQAKMSDAEISVLPRAVLETMYRNRRIIQNAVNGYPQDANIHPPVISFGSETNLDTAGVSDYLKRIEALDNFSNAGVLGKLYGDGYIILGIDDGRDYWEPVDESRIRSVTILGVKSRHYLYQDGINCEYYYLCQDSVNGIKDKDGKPIGSIRIHKSRVLRIAGIWLPDEIRNHNNYHNDSVVQAMFSEFTAYIESVAMGASMLASHSIFKYKLKDLAVLINNKQQQVLIDRFESMLMGMSAMNGLIVDADREDAEFVQRNYSGVDTLLIHLQEQMIAVCDMTRYRLLGLSNVGAFSESGLSDRYEWASRVNRYQHNYWGKELEKLVRYIMLARDGPTRGVIPQSWSIEFPSILQLTDKEEAELRLIDAQTDTLHFNMGTLVQDEIRQSRFGGTEYGREITLQSKSKDSLLINGVKRSEYE